jgi:hypothetical protein
MEYRPMGTGGVKPEELRAENSDALIEQTEQVALGTAP